MACGQAVLAAALAGLPPGAHGLPDDVWTPLLRQVEAAKTLLEQRFTPEREGCSSVAPDPQEADMSARWLGTASAAMARLPDGFRFSLLPVLADACVRLIYGAKSAQYRQALQQQPAALASLLEALALCMPAAAAALLKPIAEGTRISGAIMKQAAAANAVNLLGSELLRPALRQLLVDSDARRAAVADQLLRCTADLVKRLPHVPVDPETAPYESAPEGKSGRLVPLCSLLPRM
ncbi:hypothetical protein ABPG75_007713 [Micractinium tetrahymenae]